MLKRLAVAEIDLSAYRYNLFEIRKIVSPQTKIMAVVKANAYGHGAIEIARQAELAGADYLGVVCLKEAEELRKANIKLPILILNYIDPEAGCAAVDLQVALTIMDNDVLARVALYAKQNNKKAVIHIKVDTGMHRAGVMPKEVIPLIQKAQALDSVVLEGIYTHFATADDTDLSFAQEQLSVFMEVLDEMKANGIIPSLIHAANSAATVQMPASHFSMVRPGILSYGLHPNPGAFPLPFVPRPVLRVKTQIIQIRNIEAGESVGYGRTFIAKQKTKVALLPIGYGDGFRRAPKHFGEVLVQGKRAPIIGRISMDQSSIDITHIPNVQVGDEVVIIGSQGNDTITADEIAQKIGTINYEVVTSMNTRIERKYA